ncbi:MAG: YggS family pyridoxal phosphate-dependent enzyme [Clostridium sp.]
MELMQNINEVYDNIKKAAKVSGRSEEDITLIAVSKTKPIEMIIEARKCGIKTFGENKVQEVMDKFEHIEDASWHFIGKLQKNKVKYIIDKVCLIHSLDSVSLAEEINKRAEKKGIVANALIQINIGNEETKSGIQKEDLDSFINNLKEFRNIKICGLMAIPPICSSEEARSYFKEMKKLFDHLKGFEDDSMKMEYLSMGMTGDYEVAIEEGSNMVRVGTGIFGQRDYLK